MYPPCDSMMYLAALAVTVCGGSIARADAVEVRSQFLRKQQPRQNGDVLPDGLLAVLPVKQRTQCH